jgi:uncharacterized membrane protein
MNGLANMLSDLGFLIILVAAVVFLVRRRGVNLQERLEKTEAAIVLLQQDLERLRRGGGGPAAAHPEGWPAPIAGSTAGDAPPPPPTVPAAPQSGPPTSVPPLAAANDTTPPAPAEGIVAAQSLEERLGAHWSVIVGGLALAFGGIFLVRYSIEAGLLGPGVRVALGALLAAALLGLGEKSRRGEILQHVPQLPAAHIPSVLTAAGTAVAFGTIYAGHALYGFIGPAIAFLLLGGVALATMWAAILHGPALAALGLAGSYVVPLLLASDKPSPWPVLVYLAAVAIAAYLLARMRRWLWLAATAVGGAFAWGLFFAFQADLLGDPWMTAAMLHAGIQTVLAVAFMAIEPHAGVRDEDAAIDWIGSAALAALTVLVILVQAPVPTTHGLWLPFALAMIGLLAVTGWMSAPIAVASVLAGIASLGIVLGWRGLAEPPADSLLAPEMARVLRLPENVRSYLMFSVVAVIPAALMAERRLRRGDSLAMPIAGLYALAATVPALIALVLVYLRVTQFDSSIYFGCTGIALAALYAASANHFETSERMVLAAGRLQRPAYTLAAGAFAAAAIAAFSFALVATLSRGYLTVAFALSALGAAFVAVRKDIPLLRYAVTALGLVVLGRVAWDPRIMGDSVGSTPILNWLLIGYGVPAVAFGSAAILLRRQGDDWAVRLSDGLAVLFAGLLVFLQTHHWMAGGDITTPITGFVEQGLLAVLSLGFTHVLSRLDLARANPVFRAASLMFAGIGLLMIVVGLGIWHNPLFSGDRVAGSAVLSTLLPAYLLPGLAALFVARTARGIRPDWFVRTAAIVGILLVFGYASLEVRHIFQGPLIGFLRRTTSAEVWGYTAAWLALAVVLLAYGFWRESAEARMASAILIAIVLVKLVLIDLSGVSGIWRALSFLCVGAVLVGIGRVYQSHIVARLRPMTPPAGGGGAPPG